MLLVTDTILSAAAKTPVKSPLLPGSLPLVRPNWWHKSEGGREEDSRMENASHVTTEFS